MGFILFYNLLISKVSEMSIVALQLPPNGPLNTGCYPIIPCLFPLCFDDALHWRYASYYVNKVIGDLFVYKTSSISPLHHKSKQRRQQPWDHWVASSVKVDLRLGLPKRNAFFYKKNDRKILYILMYDFAISPNVIHKAKYTLSRKYSHLNIL